MFTKISKGRRFFLKASALSAVSLAPTLRPAMAGIKDNNSYTYEVIRSENEWRAILDNEEYRVLRDFKTEKPHSHAYSKASDNGTYACRGVSWTFMIQVGK